MFGLVGRLGFVEPGLLPTFPLPDPGNGNGLGRACPSEGGFVPGVGRVVPTSGGLIPGFVLGREGVVGLISIGGLTMGFMLTGGIFGRVAGRLGLAGFVSGRTLIPPSGFGNTGNLLLSCPMPIDGRSLPSVGKEGREGSVDGRFAPGFSFGFDGRTDGTLTDGTLILGFVTPDPLIGLELPSDGLPKGRFGFW
jgi:hypothetical protein